MLAWCARACARVAAASKINNNRVPGLPKPTCENRKRRQIPRTAWLELAVCVCLDGIGDASYLKPGLGEFYDLIFAFVIAFAIELLFDWKLLAGGWVGAWYVVLASVAVGVGGVVW